jgi:hypothetical protein
MFLDDLFKKKDPNLQRMPEMGPKAFFLKLPQVHDYESLLKEVGGNDVLRKAILGAQGTPFSFKDELHLSGEELKNVCLTAGLFEACEQAREVCGGKKKEVFLEMSDEYLEAIGAKSSTEAVNMITNYHAAPQVLSGAKAEIDAFLKRKGHDGIYAVWECIQRNVKERRIRLGKSKALHCTIVEGKEWFINEKSFDDPKERSKCLVWLGCLELGVPKDLCERLMVEMDSEEENEK